MATDSAASPTGRSCAMPARDPAEPHRVATPLELFFDLVFVVAIAQAASSLHHALAENHPAEGAIGYAVAFFAIWWAWMNWTWFASAFDSDDALYRVATFVQMFGALILAAGVSDASEGRSGIAVTGYVVMRLAQVGQWLRAAANNPEVRPAAYRYAVGITLVQAFWIVRLAVPGGWGWAGLGLLVVAELGIPWWAERARPTPWHPHHIAERYTLMTIIVLGESVLASTLAVRSALLEGTGLGTLLGVALAGFVVVCAMWWLYTAYPAHRFLVRGIREAFPWGYGHYLVFGSIAAFGAGLAAVVEAKSGHGHVEHRVLALGLAIPVAVFLVTVWLVHVRPHRPGALRGGVYLGTAALVVLSTGTTMPLEVIAVVMAVAVAVLEGIGRQREGAASAALE